MSQVPPPVFACNTCQWLLSVKICKSNKNGNVGRAYTSCCKKHADNAHCNFFAWVDAALSPPSSCFASSSPASSPTLPALPSTQPTAAPPATWNPSSTLVSCLKVGCNTMRLHPTCTCQMCHQHCLEAGGCHRIKTHMCETTGTSASDKEKPKKGSLLSQTMLASIQLLPKKIWSGLMFSWNVCLIISCSKVSEQDRV